MSGIPNRSSREAAPARDLALMIAVGLSSDNFVQAPDFYDAHSFRSPMPTAADSE